MVLEAEKQDVKVLSESIFWDESDPRWWLSGKSSKSNVKALPLGGQVIDMERDAYIWAFTGTRGAGKSIAMTYYAALANYSHNMRIVSNYPIKYMLKIGNSFRAVEAEPLDMYKLLCFDKDYQHCLILIDESPDIISHMASMTWKNRLLNIFVRQLRKNMNSLFLGCQQLGLIDKSMRWQTDVVVKCQDAFRKYGASSGLERGACVLLDFYDNSGQWTGDAINADWDSQLAMVSPTDSIELPGRVVWGAYDTYFQQDVFESLRKVDMKLGAYEVGEGDKVDYSYLKDQALPLLKSTLCEGKSLADLRNKMGGIDNKEFTYLKREIVKAGGEPSANGKYIKPGSFDIGLFTE